MDVLYFVGPLLYAIYFLHCQTTVQIISDNEARLISDGPGGDVTSKASGNTMTVVSKG